MLELYKNFALTLPSKELKSSFHNLPADSYIKGDFDFRQRRYANCLVRGDEVMWLEGQNFWQSKEINNYLGDVARRYEDLESSTKTELQNGLIKKISALFPQNELHLGIHQMRTIANDIYSARPAPEGIHQDGFDFVGIFAVHESNINGGISILLNNDNRDEVVFEQKLTPGQLCIFNDRELAHYVTPFTPKYPGTAHRDVFVFTVEFTN